MTAFNTVRFKVKPGFEREFLDAHRSVGRNWSGLRHANIVDAGEGRYWVDEAKYETFRGDRRTIVWWVLAVVAGLGLAALLVTNR